MTRLLGAALLFLAAAMLSQTSYANDCESAYNIGDTARSNITSNCHSEHYTNYDPYNPSPYLAKYFRFSLERDADVKFEASGPGKMYLIRGTNRTGTVIKSTTNRVMKLHLSTGDYILEYANSYTSSFTLVSSFNDTGNTTCVNALTFGNTVRDGWVPGCSSNNRDIADPYSPVPDQGHRAKYFTFTLEQDSDIAVSVTSEVSPYIYILEGHGEFGAIQQEISGNSSNIFLTAGQYTVELTTQNRYDPGQFELIVSEIASGATCERAINFNETISDAWSPTCNIRSWIPGNSDPYAGQNPERAKYYTFTLNDASDIRFSLQPGNSNKTLLNLYRAGDYGNKVASTRPSTPWPSPATSISEHLASGDYVLEVTQFDQTAIGSFSIQAEKLTSECNINVPYSGSPVAIDSRLSSNCTTEFRGIDGVFDPYGVQQGTYYAKRFEFTLENTAAVRIAASGQQSSYLYLAKKGELDNLAITESYRPNHWSTTTSPSVTRELAPGTYIAEITSHYPGRSFDIRFSLSSASSSCELSAVINERKNAQLDSRCEAKSKDSVRNPNPYSSPDYFRYYAKRFTFEVRESKTYEISVSSSGFGTHAFLMRGGDHKGELIDDFYTTSSGKLSRDFTLSPGIYTLEATSTDHTRSGAIQLLVWDKNTPVNDQCIVEIDAVSNSFSGSLEQECKGSQRGSDAYYKQYEFDVSDSVAVFEAEVTVAGFDTYLYLSEFKNNNWTQIASDDDGGVGSKSKISRALTAGKYRLEVTSFSGRTTGSFTLKVDFPKDTDKDGIPDNVDPDPQTAYQCTQTIDINQTEEHSGYILPSCKTEDSLLSNFEFELGSENSIHFRLTKVTTHYPTIRLLMLEDGEWKVVSSSTGIWLNLSAGRYRIAFSTGAQVGLAGFSFTTELLPDSDKDGIFDRDDAFPNNPHEIADADKDGQGDVIDQDDDNDGVADIVDTDPRNSSRGKIENYVTVSGKTAAKEGDGITLLVARNTGRHNATKYYYYTYDITAAAGKDYSPTIGVFDFSEDKHTATVTIDTLTDSHKEGNETLALVVFPAGRSYTENGQVIALSITDDLPVDITEFTESDYLISERDSYVNIEIQRKGDLSKAESLMYLSVDGTAAALEDYLPVSGKLEFEPQESSKVITVPLILDDKQEAQEYFRLQLFSATGDQIDSSKVIFESENTITPDIGYWFLTENNQGVIRSRLEDYRLVIKRTGPLEESATARINITRTQDGNASVTPVTAHFPAKKDLAYIKLPYTRNFANLYRSESLTFEFVSAVPEGKFAQDGVRWELPPQANPINDENDELVFANGTTQTSIAENRDAQLVLIRPFSKQERNYALKTSDQAPLEEDPYIQHLDTNYDLNADLNSHSILIKPINNTVFQNEHEFTIDISGNRNSKLTVTIKDKEDLFKSGALKFSSDAINAEEKQGRAGFVIQRILGDLGELSAQLSTRDGSAKAGVHYKALEEGITLGNGQTASPQLIELINDQQESGELFFYVDLKTDLGDGKTVSVSLKVNIIDAGLPSVAPTSDQENDSSDNGGALQLIWLLLLMLPLAFVRVRKI